MDEYSNMTLHPDLSQALELNLVLQAKIGGLAKRVFAEMNAGNDDPGLVELERSLGQALDAHVRQESALRDALQQGAE